MSAPVCAESVDFSVLIDYWLGDLARDQEERVEEHFLGCAACSETVADLVALAGGVRSLSNGGVVRAVVTSGFLDRLVGEGLRVREYRLAPGGRVECTVAPSDDLVAARLVADLPAAEQIDLVACDAEGREAHRLKDIPVHPSAREVVLLERTDRLRALPACVQRMKLVALATDGERLLGEYTFVHTPSSRD